MTLFDMGKVVTTSGVMGLMVDDDKFATQVRDSLRRHSSGDWGDISKEDKDSNDVALRFEDSRIFSSYDGIKKIWIITEWDRSVTTILFPEEY